EVSEETHDAAVLVIPEPVAERKARDLALELQFAREPCAHLVPLRRRIVDRLAVDLLRLREPEHVHDPGAERLRPHPRPLPLEEAEHPEVPVALGRLRPELAGDLDHRLHAQTVDVDAADALARSSQRLDRLWTIEMVVNLSEHIHRVAHHLLAV